MANYAIPLGSLVVGKWNKGRYRIERELGQGANGKVYLVRQADNLFAMKIGADLLDLQVEINALQAMAQSYDAYRRYLIDVDDWRYDGQLLPYYIMKYVKGCDVTSFIRSNGADWLFPIGSYLLQRLCELHAQHWVFGDLKTEHVIVSENGEVELVDYGGMTRIGRSVKQYTEVYDRGHWGAGSRTADESYDLFAFAILVLMTTGAAERIRHASLGLVHNRNVVCLLHIISTNPRSQPFAPFLRKAVQGQYGSSTEAWLQWRKHILQPATRPTTSVRLPWLKGFFVASLLLFSTALFFTYGSF